MAAFMVRIPDDRHERLKELAQARGMSLNNCNCSDLATQEAQRVLDAFPDDRYRKEKNYYPE